MFLWPHHQVNVPEGSEAWFGVEATNGPALDEHGLNARRAQETDCPHNLGLVERRVQRVEAVCLVQLRALRRRRQVTVSHPPPSKTSRPHAQQQGRDRCQLLRRQIQRWRRQAPGARQGPCDQLPSSHLFTNQKRPVHSGSMTSSAAWMAGGSTLALRRISPTADIEAIRRIAGGPEGHVSAVGDAGSRLGRRGGDD